ncbi:MAG: hypothetical protein ICV60_04210 [Pyrinomonadaceae bacterium]|nr:hypothetical protein [Pyrinomonadaceae bacterium]
MDYPKPKLVATNKSQEREIPSFGRWLLELGRSIKTVPAATMLLTPVGTAIYGAVSKTSYLSDPKYLLPITSGAQCLFILFFVFLSRFTKVRGFSEQESDARDYKRLTALEGCASCANIAPENLGRVRDIAVRAMRHYRNYWMILWLSWLLLYAVFTFMHIVEDEKIRIPLKVFATFVNNGAALSFLYCYLTLSRPASLGIRSDKGEGQADWFVWVAILVMLTIFEATLVTLAMAGKLPAWFGIFAREFANKELNEGIAKGISSAFGWISGICSAVVMCFYTRRLASRFMDCPTWVIVLLYVYAALQPGFGVIGPDNPWETVVLLNFALVLKTLLFFYMMWVFRYGWLLYYFSQIAQFDESAISKMKTFSQLLE